MIARARGSAGDADVSAWFTAATSIEIDRGIREVYHLMARETDARKPRCDASGRCCRFEAWGHRLYVTGLEAAWFLTTCAARGPGAEPGATGNGGLSVPAIDAAIAQGACPFLAGRLCSVHAIRPMGCRSYFCDESAQEWQRELFERCHRMIADLHDRFHVPYEFTEWRAVLRRIISAEPELAASIALPVAENGPTLIQVGRS